MEEARILGTKQRTMSLSSYRGKGDSVQPERASQSNFIAFLAKLTEPRQLGSPGID